MLFQPWGHLRFGVHSNMKITVLFFAARTAIPIENSIHNRSNNDTGSCSQTRSHTDTTIHMNIDTYIETNVNCAVVFPRYLTLILLSVTLRFLYFPAFGLPMFWHWYLGRRPQVAKHRDNDGRRLQIAFTASARFGPSWPICGCWRPGRPPQVAMHGLHLDALPASQC